MCIRVRKIYHGCDHILVEPLTFPCLYQGYCGTLLDFDFFIKFGFCPDCFLKTDLRGILGSQKILELKDYIQKKNEDFANAIDENGKLEILHAPEMMERLRIVFKAEAHRIEAWSHEANKLPILSTTLYHELSRVTDLISYPVLCSLGHGGFLPAVEDRILMQHLSRYQQDNYYSTFARMKFRVELDDKTRSRLSKYAFKPVLMETLAHNEMVCSICQESFGIPNSEGVVEFPVKTRCRHGGAACCDRPGATSIANHVFGEKCIRKWLENHSSCPSCRAVLLPLRVDEEQFENEEDARAEDDAIPEWLKRFLEAYRELTSGQ